MKALWILNSPIGTAAQVLGYSHAASGTWIAAAELRLKELLPDLVIDYAVLGYKDHVAIDDSIPCTVYELSMKQCRGKRLSKSAIEAWKSVIQQEKPDLIHIWGTEFTNPLDVVDACGDIPVAVTIQGVIMSLAKFCESDVPFEELMKGHLLLALPAYFRAKLREKAMIRQVKYEREIIDRADAVLLDNQWSAAFCRIASSKAEFIDFPLALNQVFESIRWNYENCEKNTLFTIAPSSSMKGAHILLKALAIVKKQYPDIKLRIPGSLDCGRFAVITEPPYFRYLKRLISELGLDSNVEFCGKLTSEQMAEQLSRSNVFVMPSKAENISTSLREAMWVGCPCVTSMVGAVQELVVHGENALCFRYEEYEVLAFEIMKLLNEPELAQKISVGGNRTIQNKYPMNQPLTSCADWYKKVLEKTL